MKDMTIAVNIDSDERLKPGQNSRFAMLKPGKKAGFYSSKTGQNVDGVQRNHLGELCLFLIFG